MRGHATSFSGVRKKSSNGFQLIDAISNGSGETGDFIRRRAAGLEPFPELGVSDAAEVLHQPLNVRGFDVCLEPFGVLARVAELDKAAFNTFDEFLGLAAVALTVPFLAAEIVAPFAHRAAPIRDHVAVFNPGVRRDLIDGGVRAAFDVAYILVIPVRGQHHDDLKAVELLAADKAIVDPAPALFVFQFANALVAFAFKTGVDEAAVGLNHLLGAVERAKLFNFPGRHKIGGLDEIATGPCDAGGEGFGVNLGAELRGPLNAVGVGHFHFGICAGFALFHKREGGFGSLLTAADSADEIEGLDSARIRPYDRPSGDDRVRLVWKRQF